MRKHVFCGGQGLVQRGLYTDASQCGGQLVPRQRFFPRCGLPQSGQQSPCGAALQKQSLLTFNQRHRHGHLALGLGRGLHRQLVRPASRIAPAQIGQRAFLTVGRAGDADQRTQLHQGLVVGARRGLGHLVQHPHGKGFLRCRGHDVGVVVVQPRKNAQDVAVHRGDGNAKRNAGHRARRIVTDARQTAQGVVVGGQVAAVLLADDAGSLLHIIDAVVVAQPLPQLAQGVRLTGRQRGGVRQSRDKSFIIGDGRCHTCLLEHDLADPDMVRRRLLPERQEPLVCVKPLQQRCGNGLHQKPPQVRGKGMTSRMLGMPVTYISRRSKPRP